MAYISKSNQVRSFTPHKTKSKKKPKSDGKTPIPTGEKICQCGCGNEKYLSIHHVFGGSSRKFSNRFKCVEWLCYHSHQDSFGIHGSKNPNIELDYKLKVNHQQRLLDEGMTITEFKFYFKNDYIAMGLDGYIRYRTKELV